MSYVYRPNPLLKVITCHRCGLTSNEQFILPFVKDLAPICAACYRNREVTNKKPQIIDEPNPSDLSPWIDRQLESIGLSSVEREASMERIRPDVLEKIPDRILCSLTTGWYWKVPGLGLAGRPELGKTMALAALLRAYVTAYANNYAPFIHLTGVHVFQWLNWPLTAHQWRLDGINPKIPEAIKSASKVNILILDDIGRETNRRASSEDVVTGHLDAILTQRDREGLVTLWTTNVSEDELYERYGTGMVRRLFRLNPPVWIGL